jgi:hypothetical protein
MRHPPSAKVGTNLDDKQRLLGQYSSLEDQGQGVELSIGFQWIIMHYIPEDRNIKVQ